MKIYWPWTQRKEWDKLVAKYLHLKDENIYLEMQIQQIKDKNDTSKKRIS